MHEAVIILDFGSQYSLLIARRIRELGVYCEILPCTTPAEEIAERKPSAVVLSGGPASVHEPDSPTVDVKLFELDVPGTTSTCKAAAVGNAGRRIYAVQFHPEFKSYPTRPHPLFAAFVRASVQHTQEKTG